MAEKKRETEKKLTEKQPENKVYGNEDYAG
jgi:hypothetical protein